VEGSAEERPGVVSGATVVHGGELPQGLIGDIMRAIVSEGGSPKAPDMPRVANPLDSAP